MTSSPSTPASPSPSGPPLPDVHPSGRLRVSLIWLVPLLAALVGLGLVVRTWLQTGPTITISFNTAEGLVTGTTEVRYKDVVVGKVSGIVLNDDDSGVIVTVELTPSAARLAVQDTRFWVVRPRIGIGGVSGISTLLSGAYIGVDVGRSKEVLKAFKGLDKPPAVTHDQKGSKFTLTTQDAGSISIGAPVYYRRVAVGQVVDATLDPDGRRITIQVFVEAPYDRFVTRNTRFWNAGGVDLAVSSEGLKLNTQSLATVLAGGIAFQPADENNPGEPASLDSTFELYADAGTALAPADGPSIEALLVFRESTRGLAIGTPVDFLGIVVGRVKDIQPEYDTSRRSFFARVRVELFLERLGPAYRTLTGLDGDAAEAGMQPPLRVLRRLIDQGLHGQLRAGNLLTGQQYVALFFKPGNRKLVVQRKDSVPEIPSAPGSLEEIQTQIESIVTKLDSIPIVDIANDLRSTVQSANSLLKSLDGQVLPETKQTIVEARQLIRSLDQNLLSPDSALQQDLGRTLEQLNRTAASFRTLADYLEQHPEALLRGRPAEPEPASAAPLAPEIPPSPPLRAPTADALRN